MTKEERMETEEGAENMIESKEARDQFCVDCAEELNRKQIAAGKNGFFPSEMQRIFWTLRGIYDREGKQACMDALNNYEYKLPKRKTRGYA